ncbi:1466_t:CDS:2, partial [Funneliformis geosporum]
LDSKLQMEILHEIFDQIDNEYITDEIHDFLIIFFNDDRSAGGWAEAIDDMNINKDSFSLAGLNPLRDITILEKPHLNQFVHPIIDSALWIFAKVNYKYGEIPLKAFKTRVRADGVGFLNDHESDLQHIVIAEADSRHQLFTNLKVYGLTAFKTEVSLTMMDFRSIHRLFEIDHFGIPKDWIDMPNFAWLYEAVINYVSVRHESSLLNIERKEEQPDTPSQLMQKN